MYLLTIAFALAVGDVAFTGSGSRCGLWHLSPVCWLDYLIWRDRCWVTSCGVSGFSSQVMWFFCIAGCTTYVCQLFADKITRNFETSKTDFGDLRFLFRVPTRSSWVNLHYRCVFPTNAAGQSRQCGKPGRCIVERPRGVPNATVQWSVQGLRCASWSMGVPATLAVLPWGLPRWVF